MHISLTPALEEFVRRQVAAGAFDDPGEVVRHALALMLARDGAGSAVPCKQDAIAALKSLEPGLRARGIVSAALFGSVLRGEARPGSDVDVLIAVDPKSKFDIVDLVGIKNLLSERLGVGVDVVERDSLKPSVRDAVLGEAVPVF